MMLPRLSGNVSDDYLKCSFETKFCKHRFDINMGHYKTHYLQPIFWFMGDLDLEELSTWLHPSSGWSIGWT